MSIEYSSVCRSGPVRSFRTFSAGNFFDLPVFKCFLQHQLPDKHIKLMAVPDKDIFDLLLFQNIAENDRNDEKSHQTFQIEIHGYEGDFFHRPFLFNPIQQIKGFLTITGLWFF